MYLGAISSIMIVLILLIKKAFRSLISPKWHYYIWILLLVRLLIPFTPQSSLSVLNLVYMGAEELNLPVEAITAGGNNSFNLTAGTANTGISFSGSTNITGKSNENGSGMTSGSKAADGAAANVPPQANASTNIAGTGQSKSVSLMKVAAILWLSGMLLLATYTAYINIIFALKVKRNYKPCHDPRINDILEECQRIMGIRRSIALYTTRRPRIPSLYSSFRTKILISEAYLSHLSDQEIKYVFLHELSHYKRKDIIVNWVLTLLQIIYFFNPLIWYAFSKIHEDCEISCDAEALSYLREEEYQEYGSTVIRLIKLLSESNFIPATAGLWKHKANYKRRIIMIAKYKKGKWPNTLLTIVLILTLAFIGLTGCNKVNQETAGDQVEDISDAGKDKDSNTETSVTAAPTQTATDSPAKEETTEWNTLISLTELIGISQEELTEKLGKPDAGVDEGGVEYANLGIRTWFDENGLTNQVYTANSAIDFNGAKVGDNIISFQSVFGDAQKDNNGNAIYPYEDYYLSVFYDSSSKTVFAVYLLSKEQAELLLSNDSAGPQKGEGYFGDWVINRVAAFGSVGTYSKETAEELIGRELSFTSDSATCFGDDPSYLEETAQNPTYETTELSASDFISNYRMTFDSLGITADPVTQVVVTDSEGKGCTFLIKDENTLIFIGGGTYFELVRKAR